MLASCIHSVRTTLDLAGHSLDTVRVVYAEQAEDRASPAAMQFNFIQRWPFPVSLLFHHTYVSVPSRGPPKHT